MAARREGDVIIGLSGNFEFISSGVRCLKQATLILALLGAALLAGCGTSDHTDQTDFNNGSGDQPFKPTTHLLHRSVVSNYFGGDLAVMDATLDELTTYTFAVGAGPKNMQPSPDGTLTFVNNTASNSISSLNNNLEAVKATIQLGGTTVSYVTSTDDKFGFAAVPDYNNGLPPILPGAINRFNPTDGSLNTAIPFPYVQYLAMDPAQQHLLAFTSGDVAITTATGGVAPNGDDYAYWVDLTKTDSVTGFPPIAVLSLPAGALSKPIAAFFSADGSTAFILNCGNGGCGGSSAPSVTEITSIAYNLSSQAPFFPPSIHQGSATVVKQWQNVNGQGLGASSGLIDLSANKLYVAGSTGILHDSGGNQVQNGFFTVIDLNSGTASTPIAIGNGVKGVIRNINGVFWVASTGCGVQSCISMVNLSNNSSSVLANANGDATGISFQANSGEIYTVEGAHLYIYDQNGNTITSQYNTDVKGEPWDVLYID